ncbi:MAG: 2-oxo acid dehydrogenase subunit E2 [Dehalococcoidia bacterium]|nr:2-oxo acid dehydrogenase subunit E2 [Dehalococcoidia bacterium]
MPQMGSDMKEGKVVRWLKKVGDQVARGDRVAEIETDKAVVEIEAFGSGVLRQVVVQEGVTVPVGELIAIIAGAEEPLPERPVQKAPAALAKPGKAAAKVASAPAILAPAVPAPATPAAAEGARARSSPLARRQAEERGVDLARVTGTGPGGRITEKDVEAYAARQAAAPAPAEAPGQPRAAAPRREELTRMRLAIARRMAQSKREIPHFYLAVQVDMTGALRQRQELNDAVHEGYPKITVNDLILKAVAKALRQHPRFNATFAEDHIELHPAIHLGVAIALPDGLIAPAILDCQDKSLAQIAAATKDLVERARTGVLRADEYTAATFNVSNLGPYGIDAFTAIITYNQAASLAVGTVQEQPVAREGQVVVRQMMTATLSVDHRINDGATAAQFLKHIKDLLERPSGLLL